MQYVVSADGTRIAYKRSGAGPPLVLVHGTSTDHVRWGLLSRFLHEHFTVYAMDRRGRGDSSDATAEYSFDLEAEDVAALANSIEEGPVHLYGHSSGATLVLEAVQKIRDPGRLVLYEGVFPMGGDLVPPSLIDTLQKLLDQGDHEGLVITFLREVPRMPQHEIDHLRSLPEWPRRVATAPTLPRELRGGNNYTFAPARFSDMRVPTLLLVGSDSPEIFTKSAEVVNAALPNSRVRHLPGQQHLADLMAPDLVANAIIEFMSEDAVSVV
jgi:pimeloyl-ACP methyl ester carboxylesterase